MRTLLLPAMAAILLCGCTQTPSDMLTAGTWTCKAKGDDSQIALTFEKGGKLVGKMTSDRKDPAQTQPDVISLKMEFGGSWTLTGDTDLTFGFKDAKVIEAKRAGQDLAPEETEFFKQAFTSDPAIKSKIAMAGSKLVITQEDKDEPLECTR